MKAVRIIDGVPTLVDAPRPTGGEVVVDVASVSICGSDIHLIDSGMAEGWILGHEIAAHTSDGTPVVVEPVGRCGVCSVCESGSWHHCADAALYGIGRDGGMAEQMAVPAQSIVPLPSGIDIATAPLVEPLAVATHALHRSRLGAGDRVAVVGAGPIGLSMAVVCTAAGVKVDVQARHDQQRTAAERLGASTDVTGNYDVVFDAAGVQESLNDAIALVRNEGRIGLVGSLWNPATIDMRLCMKEVEIIPSSIYCGNGADRDFVKAAQLLAERPEIGSTLITHRFPLDGAADAFATARDRASGAIKVTLDVARSAR